MNRRRSALTLMEVLVSIFIMGIGLLAILVLFPLGALRMAQAIQDDRAGHLALNGLAVAQSFGLRGDAEVVQAFSNPGAAVNAPTPPVHPDLPGYPVYVDPVGFLSYLNPAWVGSPGTAGPGQTVIARRASNLGGGSASVNAALTNRWFTLVDDLRFNTDGTVPDANGLVEREGTLSYALMFRQPRSSVTNVVETSVVVYYRRPLTTPVGGNEASYPACFNYPSTNMITLYTANLPKPALQPGSWILDGTFKPGVINGQPATVMVNGNATPTGWAHAYFYRVVSINEPAPDVLEVEVATPLRDWAGAAPANGQANGTVIIMENVIEVLERGTGW